MKNIIVKLAGICLLMSFFIFSELQAQNIQTINLNGIWQFEQTANAFPPATYGKTIPVPGLIHLATPRVEHYDKLFKGPHSNRNEIEHNPLDISYAPKYSWYRRIVDISADLKGSEAVLIIKKSQFVTRVYVNGHFAGSSSECATPIRMHITQFLKFGQANEILISTGERIWLPAPAAGGTDLEKTVYMPGIWDDVILQFTGFQSVQNVLMLPDLKQQKVTAKILVRSLYPSQLKHGAPDGDSCRLQVEIFEPNSGKKVAESFINGMARRDNLTAFETVLNIPDSKPWSPESPVLYTAKVTIFDNGKISDTHQTRFGMRDFKIDGKHFYLNGEKQYLRGSNISLQRFFEDPECGNLAWDRKWVTRLLSDVTKNANWNAIRTSLGPVPDFWYDIADSCGLMIQNEWNHWQQHGWDENFRTEFTNWIWSDGNHPSIVIWDALNESRNKFIGNTLIPELKKLDPTRPWDAGYMDENDMADNEMNEPHYYPNGYVMCESKDFDKTVKEENYLLGKLNTANQVEVNSKAALLINEYAWIWLWRDGTPANLTINHFDYFVGKNATPKQRWALQAYWLQLETEWLRAERSNAGVLSFCMLTNNYGFTGDYFMGKIAELTPSSTLQWLKHAFAPFAVFIDLADQRYFWHSAPYEPASVLKFDLNIVNDLKTPQTGKVHVKLIDEKGKTVSESKLDIQVEAIGKSIMPCTLNLPKAAGGYLVVAELTDGKKSVKNISRRYIRIGKQEVYHFTEYELNK